jgi:hypothetical protein
MLENKFLSCYRKLFLPKPLQGWTAEETTSQAAGAAIFRGITAEREYQGKVRSP